MRWAILVALFLAQATYATGRDDERNEARADAEAAARSDATGIRGDVSAGGGDASALSEGSTATVGDVSGGSASTGDLSIGGDSVSNETNFFAFSTGFPQASGCFGGAQGGGTGGSSGGFLGLHFLNNDCWTSALAEAEANVDVRARLKCGGKKFRDAIAFDQPRRERQRYCVDYIAEIYRREIAHVEEQVSEAVETGVITEVTGDDFGYLMAQVSEEEFEEHNEEVDAELEELRRQAAAAERRARQAEQRVEELEENESSKRELLLLLQQQVREDYERTRPDEPEEK